MSTAHYWDRAPDGSLIQKPIDPKYLDPEGRIIGYAERQAASDRAKAAAAAAASIAQREADAKLSPLQKTIRAFETQEAEARRNGDSRGRKMYAEKLEGLRAELEQQQHMARTDSSPWVQNAIEQRALMAKSGRSLYSGSNPADVDLYCSLVDQRHSFPTVESFQSALTEVQTRIVNDHVASRRKAADDATLAALKANSEAANANVRLGEAKLLAVQTQGASDGN